MLVKQDHLIFTYRYSEKKNAMKPQVHPPPSPFHPTRMLKLCPLWDFISGAAEGHSCRLQAGLREVTWNYQVIVAEAEYEPQ